MARDGRMSMQAFAPSPAGRGGLGWGAFASVLPQVSERFRAAAWARATFLCLARETWPKERPPRWRALQASCLPGARAGYGVFRRHIHVPAENWPASLRAILRTFLHPPAAPSDAAAARLRKSARSAPLIQLRWRSINPARN